MHGPVPIAPASRPGYFALAGYHGSSNAISPEAHGLRDASSHLLRERERSEALFGARNLALSALTEAAGRVIPDEEQEPVAEAAFENARQFIRSLPDDSPMPEIGVDPDGAISLTWWVSQRRVFSVSVGSSERLAYAWLDGSDKGHAVDRFRAPSIPPRLLDNLRSITGNGLATLRAA